MEAGVWEILLVEDNPGDVHLTAEGLRASLVPTQLSVTSDGVEALSFLHHRDPYAAAPVPDLILLDLNLPRKSGFEVLADIKQDPGLRRIPVIILTTSAAEQDVWRAYAMHANCFISKPADLDQFLGVIGAVNQFWFRVAHLPPRGCDAGEAN